MMMMMMMILDHPRIHIFIINRFFFVSILKIQNLVGAVFVIASFSLNWYKLWQFRILENLLGKKTMKSMKQTNWILRKFPLFRFFNHTYFFLENRTRKTEPHWTNMKLFFWLKQKEKFFDSFEILFFQSLVCQTFLSQTLIFGFLK